MSSLHVTTWSMPSAHLGSENALPALGGGRNIGTSLAQPEQQSIDYPDKGRENDPLPYRMQDAWDRSRQPRTFKAIVLENKHLKATFLPELAGRLWSLVHKPANRELLFPNPVVQPGNPRRARGVAGRRCRVEHLDFRPHAPDPRALLRRRSPSRRRHAGPAPVGVRADSPGRLPDRLLAAEPGRHSC